MKKIVSVSVVIILVVGVACAGLYFWQSRPQVIHFDNGDKLTFLGAEYGKKHVVPGSKSAKAKSSNDGQNRTSFTTQGDTLVVWVRVEHEPQQYPNYQFYIYDKAGVACVDGYRNYFNNTGGQKSNEVFAIQFSAFPRRGGRLAVRVQGYVQNVGQVWAEQKFTFANPVKKSFPKWKPDSLPLTKQDGDLTMTLEQFASGVAMSYNRDQDNPDDAINKGVSVVYRLEQNGNIATNWQPASIQTSDATGNRVSGGGGIQWEADKAKTIYQWGLWPNEAAWKVRFEFSKQSGYDEKELWKVANIPFQPGLRREFENYNYNRRNTNTVVAETDLNGVHLKLYAVKQFTDVEANSTPQGGLTLLARPSPPEGTRMDIKLTDNQDETIECYNYSTWSDGKSTLYRYALRDVSGLTNLNLSIAMHKSRYFEFTVKPNPAATEDQ